MGTKRAVLYRESQFVQVVREGDTAIIWHSLFGNPQIVSASVIDFLGFFERGRTIKSIKTEYDLPPGGHKVIRELVENRFLVPDGLDERSVLAQQMCEREATITSGQLIDYLGLIMSEACNFRCTYCIHFSNLETSDRISNSCKLMTFERAQEAVDRYFDILRRSGKTVAEINFGGGEPLLAWLVIKRVLKYCSAKYGEDFTIKFSINTNGSLITDEIARILRDFRVSVAISLDGLGDFNNRVRIKRSGAGTFDDIVRGIEALAKASYPIDGVAVTVSERNFEGLNEELINWAHHRRMTEVRIDLDVVNMVNIPIEVIVERLVYIRRYARSVGIEVPGFWSRPFENLNTPILREHIAFCGAVRGNSMCVSPSGNVYGCGYSTTQLGTVSEINKFHAPGGDYHRFVREHLPGTMERCRGCMIEGQCGGGCNITQEFAHATRTAKIERMCDFYRAMTHELLIEQLEDLSSLA